MRDLSMYVAIAIVLVVVVLVMRARSRPMSPRQFAQAVLQKIERDHPEIKVKSIDGFDWKIELSGEEHGVFLNNTYSKYCLDPRHFDSIVDNFLLCFASMEYDEGIAWEEAKSRVFPQLKPLEYFEDTRQLKGGAEMIDSLLVYDYKADLRIMIVVDSERSMRGASKSDLKRWGVGKAELLNQSITNLGRLTAPHWEQATGLAREANLFAFSLQDGYDASRILLPDFHERASRALGCDKIAVGAPNRDCLMAFRATDQQLVSKLGAKVASDYQQYPYPVCPKLMFLPQESDGR